MARSSSGSGRCPLKAEITGSNPVRATKKPGTVTVSGFFIIQPLIVIYFIRIIFPVCELPPKVRV